jgi:hypothetical protein
MTLSPVIDLEHFVPLIAINESIVIPRVTPFSVENDLNLLGWGALPEDLLVPTSNSQNEFQAEAGN